MRSATRGPRVVTLAAATLLTITGLAACGGVGAAAPGPASGGTGTTPAGGAGGGGVALAQSGLYYLTKLRGGQLCGLLHPGEPAQISGGPTGPGTFVNYSGISVGCEWHSATGFGGLRVDVPTGGTSSSVAPVTAPFPFRRTRSARGVAPVTRQPAGGRGSTTKPVTRRRNRIGAQITHPWA